MTLNEIINKQTYSRIFRKAFQEGKKVVCMDSGGESLENSRTYSIVAFYEGSSKLFMKLDTDQYCLAKRFKVEE